MPDQPGVARVPAQWHGQELRQASGLGAEPAEGRSVPPAVQASHRAQGPAGTSGIGPQIHLWAQEESPLPSRRDRTGPVPPPDPS
jgi:hypothetical protein